ncbi:transmembrane protein 138-like [Maniola jurtina]|uniref:transmembrane protein 138-like n=1 Tax=Maniola jurtina TaxID=191418 RepID=UPI001E68DAAD|nr:transmembrane protein 138-like [Maniola jurtina]XP_045766026.1 transmembrane protein 138-like [Maniola jurtina]
MKLSMPRYTFCLISQLTFMFCDLIFNCVSLFPRSRDGLLVLFIFQDLFLILSITTMLMTFFSTYLFQAGLVEVLVRKFRAAGAVVIAYVVASVVLHAAWLLEKWADPESVSTPMLIVLFTLQRCLSPWYYFFYKRAALRVSDPRFYEDIDWINQQLAAH